MSLSQKDLVLRVADAYEKTTPWRQCRPDLKPGPTPERPAPHAPPTPAVTLDVATRKFVAGLATRAGLTLDETQLAFLYQGAPDVFAMADRLRQPLAWSDEPASTFRFA